MSIAIFHLLFKMDVFFFPTFKKNGEKDKSNKIGQESHYTLKKEDSFAEWMCFVQDNCFPPFQLAPSPMPGFRQPAHVGVPTKPLSRPATARSGKSIPRGRSPSPQQRPSTPT